MKRSQSETEAVAVCGERIAAVGSNGLVRSMICRNTLVIDCQGLTLLPGFNDAHCHLPGLARRMQDLNCSPDRAPSIAELQALVRDWSGRLSPDRWVRGFAYDDLQMVEGRHPDRHDLDAAAPNHPVWLEHRSGHASTLNSRALELAGIGIDTPDPLGGVIERDLSTGKPTGTLFEAQAFLRQQLGNTRDPQDFRNGMKAVDQLLPSYGITSVQDAGADNGIERWQTFLALHRDEVLSGRITMFAGIRRLGEFAEHGLAFGKSNHRLRLGHAKIMCTLTAGSLIPSPAELNELVREAHLEGFPVAIHCIEEEAISAAAEVLQACRLPGLSDRIEHCAEGTPEMIKAISRSGATVVTQPGFIFHNGTSYRRNVEPRLLPDLYPTGALLRSGVTTAFGSDAPVIDPNPWPAIYSAVTRCSSDGLPLAPSGADTHQVSVADALRMYTLRGAEAEGKASEKGSIAIGKLADLILVDADPLAVEVERLRTIQAVMTIRGGEVIWGQI